MTYLEDIVVMDYGLQETMRAPLCKEHMTYLEEIILNAMGMQRTYDLPQGRSGNGWCAAGKDECASV